MTNLNTRTPSGDGVTQRVDMKPAFSEDLLEHVLQPENLQVAWKHVRANKGAAGIDGMTVDAFPASLTYVIRVICCHIVSLIGNWSLRCPEKAYR